jgi:hypothetical protein
VAGGGGLIVAGQALHGTQMVDGMGLAAPVANIAVERLGLLHTFGGGGVVPGLLLDDAQLMEGIALAVAVTEVTEQLKRPPAAGGGGLVVPGLPSGHAQIVQGVGLPRPVAEVAVERQRLGRAGGGGPVVTGTPLSGAQVHESAGLAGPVTGLARRGKGGLVKRGGLVQMAPDIQEISHDGRDGNGMLGRLNDLHPQVLTIAPGCLGKESRDLAHASSSTYSDECICWPPHRHVLTQHPLFGKVGRG